MSMSTTQDDVVRPRRTWEQQQMKSDVPFTACSARTLSWEQPSSRGTPLPPSSVKRAPLGEARTVGDELSRCNVAIETSLRCLCLCICFGSTTPRSHQQIRQLQLWVLTTHYLHRHSLQSAVNVDVDGLHQGDGWRQRQGLRTRQPESTNEELSGLAYMIVTKGLQSPDIIQSFSEMVVRIMYSLPPDVMWRLRWRQRCLR
ncbi:hypothetical protein WJX82_010302 [Trebouxia sp. C0006]